MIDADAINHQLADGQALLVDVRRDEEWSSGHARGAVHLSLDRIMAGEAPTSQTDRRLYVYCASGNRSAQAAAQLQSQGFDAFNIGGLADWVQAGGQIEA